MGMVAQTHPDYWEEADKFMPERWLDPVKSKEYAMSWYAFSAGFVFLMPHCLQVQCVVWLIFIQL